MIAVCSDRIYIRSTSGAVWEDQCDIELFDMCLYNIFGFCAASIPKFARWHLRHLKSKKDDWYELHTDYMLNTNTRFPRIAGAAETQYSNLISTEIRPNGVQPMEGSIDPVNMMDDGRVHPCKKSNSIWANNVEVSFL